MRLSACPCFPQEAESASMPPPSLLDRLAAAGTGDDPLPLLAAVADAVRPARGAGAAARLRELAEALAAQPAARDGLRRALLGLLAQRHAVLLLATSGIYPATGVVAESYERLMHKLLPEADDPIQLKSALGRIFRRGDAEWLEALPAAEWAGFMRVLDHGAADDAALESLFADLIEALRVVSHRIAAGGLEPEMLRLDPSLELHASPFLAQCEEALAFAARSESARREGACLADDERHLLVLLEQCREAIERVRRRARQQGASFHLTFRLRRLRQLLERAQQLAGLAAALCAGGRDAAAERIAELWHELALAECRRNDLRRFWRQNLELVALRVTENEGRIGEHYISETRPEYFGLLRSAAGGGCIIALMAAAKLWLATLGLAPLAEVFAFCLNYALGFVLIHMLGFSVATKQPAMTANAIAAAIDETEGRERDMEPLAALVARTLRSQLAAIAGNVGLAVPAAMLFAAAAFALTGAHYVAPEKAVHLLQEIDPAGSGALLYAAVAGVCLFLAGLIAGYYDNLCAYNRIPQRLRQLAWPARLLGAARWERSVAYIGDHLGALAGNFFFGLLLGGAAGLGDLLGLPLDIRHIAFSSAYWGYALAGLEFKVDWALAGLAAAGVFAIGLVNLLVSFYLAIWVGLKARGVTFDQRLGLAKAIGRRLLRQPREFFLPPRAAPSE